MVLWGYFHCEITYTIIQESLISKEHNRCQVMMMQAVLSIDIYCTYIPHYRLFLWAAIRKLSDTLERSKFVREHLRAS